MGGLGGVPGVQGLCPEGSGGVMGLCPEETWRGLWAQGHCPGAGELGGPGGSGTLSREGWGGWEAQEPGPEVALGGLKGSMRFLDRVPGGLGGVRGIPGLGPDMALGWCGASGGAGGGPGPGPGPEVTPRGVWGSHGGWEPLGDTPGLPQLLQGDTSTTGGGGRCPETPPPPQRPRGAAGLPPGSSPGTGNAGRGEAPFPAPPPAPGKPPKPPNPPLTWRQKV